MIDWSNVDPLLTGPQAAARGAAKISFEIPATPASGFCFGNLSSGPAWPRGLAPLERIAAVPRPADIHPEGADEVVLFFELPGEPRWPVCTRNGNRIRWAVDPAAWIEGLLQETYVERWTRPLPSLLPLLNYSRLPHAVKGLFERLQSPRAAARNPVGFPDLPLDDLVERLRGLCVALAFDGAPSAGSLWPGGRRAVVTLTHDVDTGWILADARSEQLQEILEVETSLGWRGAWYVPAVELAPARQARALRAIAAAGHELGCHGWNHDAKLAYLTASRRERRMRRILSVFGDAEPPGIRTPWYARGRPLAETLDRYLAYDSSVPNASSFFSARTNSGCCTLFPYRLHGDTLELPMTLPPDTALDRERGYDLLLELSARIVEAGGVIVVTLHPQPHQSGNEAGLASYFAFLRELAARHAGDLWSATPREIVCQYQSALAREQA